MTITELANMFGITAKTIIRWEKSGKIKKAPRDWKGWRKYGAESMREIREIMQPMPTTNDRGRG